MSGYVGQHCAAERLRRGYTVRGTIRSTAKAERIRAALEPVTDRIEALSFHEADLLSDAG